MYPTFEVPGVKSEDVWRLFNTSNYQYYRQTVHDLRDGKCPFCRIDPAVNTVLFENTSWRIWKNTMAPRSGQECQLIIPSKRHVDRLSDLSIHEWTDLQLILDWLMQNLGVGDDGVYVIRTGDPSRNAKSVPHLHVNFQYPTGKDRVEVTIAKSSEDLEKKLPVLSAFEKYRAAEEAGHPNPSATLSDAEWDLIKNKMTPPAK
ncbi:MAG: hypothetical protein V4473_02755 [Patescibacteria group bacterium]